MLTKLTTVFADRVDDCFFFFFFFWLFVCLFVVVFVFFVVVFCFYKADDGLPFLVGLRATHPKVLKSGEETGIEQAATKVRSFAIETDEPLTHLVMWTRLGGFHKEHMCYPSPCSGKRLLSMANVKFSLGICAVRFYHPHSPLSLKNAGIECQLAE